MVKPRQPDQTEETVSRTDKPLTGVDDPAREEAPQDEAEGGAVAPARPKSRPAAEPDDEGPDAPPTTRAPWLPPARR